MKQTEMRFAVMALMLLSLASIAPAAPAKGKDLRWKPVNQALLKLDNHPVKNWDILQPEKDRNLVLVQVEKRCFVFALKQKRVYAVERSEYRAEGADLIGPAPDRNARPVKTAGWDSHDVGPAQQITVRLADTGEVLAIELPHPVTIY